MLYPLAQLASQAPTEPLSAAATTTNGGAPSILEMLTHSGPVVTATLLVLVFFSITSWSIILFKYIQFKRAKSMIQSFLKSFNGSLSLDEMLNKSSAKQEGNPLSRLFNAGLSEILRYKQQKDKSPSPPQPRLSHIQDRVFSSQQEENHRLSEWTPFLATTASACPFIGLFGTVWGILTAFFAIGQMKSTSLAVVGPYIAEALIATAVGLAAAIPAVMAYNYFTVRLKSLRQEMESFGTRLVHRIESEYF
ncbi:MAG: MotA/TolQ/ExbB proton channel family protein [Deltaproteobacteria bacterium]|nr:MotA/TolQ/ExbB proton channel family protein [Deltaproteobacteria bacterium]